MRFASFSVRRTVEAPAPRGSGLISVSASAASFGMRFAYSAKPASIQAGMRFPTARTTSFTSFAGRTGSGALAHGTRWGPELLEVVVLPDRGLHDVRDHRAEIDQYPFSGLLPLDAVE